MALIIDFDGTIADTFSLYIQIMREIHVSFKFKYISDTSIPLYRGMTAREVMRSLNISRLRIPVIAQKIRSESGKYIAEQSVFPHLKAVLKQLKSNGHRLFILSSNSEENIRTFLEKNQANYFDDIFSDSSIFGKVHILKKMLKEKNINPKHAYYIGDETRDIEAAKRNKIKIISVSWGYNDRKILERMEPDHLIDHPEELLELLEVT